MKFGFRMPSLKKRVSARLSPARFVRHNLGLKAPRGWGWVTNPKKAAYNRVYNRTTRGCLVIPAILLLVIFAAMIIAYEYRSKLLRGKDTPMPAVSASASGEKAFETGARLAGKQAEKYK